jgi:hypothetical protein
MRLSLVFAAALAASVAPSCGSYASGPPGPKTAAERARAERAAAEQAAAEGSAGEDAPVSGDGKSWGGWRYQGRRDDCFFVVERDCFTTLAAACEATECKVGCTSRGAGPAIVYCK